MAVKNVLVLMGDHLRYDAMGFMGNPHAHTPNLDRLASESVRFERCYTQSPVCCPARHSLATGRYPHAQGVIGNSSPGPFPGMHTIAHAVRSHGIRAFNHGHMHWKDPEKYDNGYENDPKASSWMAALPEKQRQIRQSFQPYFVRNCTSGPSPLTAEQHWGHFVAEDSMRHIRNAVEKGERFLSWTAFTEPHPPWRPPRTLYENIDPAAIVLPEHEPPGAPVHEFIAELRKDWEFCTEWEVRQMIAAYYGMVGLLDAYVGRMLDLLDELGIRNETAILFTSDHGDQLWEHKLFMKYVMFEGSTHVPCFVSVPGMKSGQRPELVEHVDFFSAICELFDIPISPSAQGRSLLPLLESGAPPSDWRDAVFSQQLFRRMIRTERWKYITYHHEPGELYDLQTDPRELKNLLHDPSCAGTAQELALRLDEWEKKYGP